MTASRGAGAPVLTAVAAGGAVGGVLRHLAEVAGPDAASAVTILVVNVVGAGLLALLPALPPVRRSRLLAAGLGPGVLGGFTTTSTASEQTRALLADGDALLALGYVGLTLGAALLAVGIVTRLLPAPEPPAPTR